MDVLDYVLAALVAVLAITAWMMWGKAYSLQLDLDFAENEIIEAHRTIDRLTRQAREGRPSRGARGRFAKPEGATPPPGMGPSSA